MSKLIDVDALWMDIIHSMDYCDDILEIVDRQPTVESERKTGEWIPAFNGEYTGGAYWFYCSICNRIVPDVRNGGWEYCPTCGSYNGGEQ